jgi:hypothetical protein
MQIERVRPAVFQITLHAYELATLVAAARVIAQGKGRLTRHKSKRILNAPEPVAPAERLAGQRALAHTIPMMRSLTA